MRKVFLLGVGVDPIRLADLLDKISLAGLSKGRLLIAHVNLRGLNLAYEQPFLKEFYNRYADVVYCDGMGVKLGAFLSGKAIQERYTLADWVWDLAERASEERLSLFLLGNPPGVADSAAKELQMRFPRLRIAGVQHGYFEKEPQSSENEAVIQRINRLNPDILLVGFCMPIQEKWLTENWSRLNVHIAVTCGALFEYLAGQLRRGPRWMTQHYLEWLARILISPGRYSWRYLRDIPLFFYRIVRERIAGE